MHKRKGDLFICTKVERQAFEWIQIAFREEKKQIKEKNYLEAVIRMISILVNIRSCLLETL